jgi:hypothetical protein
VTDFIVFYTNVYPVITEVRLYEETIEHIKTSHPEVPIELPSVLNAIENAVKEPSWIEVGQTPNSYVYVDHNSTNKSGDPLRVPVKVVEGTSGYVKTAFFANHPSPKIVWSKG